MQFLPEIKQKILIVDDTPNNLYSFRMILTKLGAQIITASSGDEALRTLLDHPDVTVILMDVQMPGMDGFETAELIRGQPKFRHVPILFVTAVYQSDDHAQLGFQVGGSDYIRKPVAPTILEGKVRVFLEMEQHKLKLAAANEQLQAEIARREEAEATLVAQAELLRRRNAELQQFAYIASHDLQEPLRMITNYLQLLNMDYAAQLDEVAQQYINFAVDGAERMRGLILDLLTYSRLGMQEVKKEAISLSALLAKVVHTLEPEMKAVGGQVEIGDMPTVYADETRIRQLFQNLIGNGLKFNHSPTPRVEIAAKEEGDRWQISVRDNGIGIDPQHQERIFVIFQRLHTIEEYAGTGIGLAICKKIVEQHGGEIGVESSPGAGTTFHFTLPAELPVSASGD